MRGGDPGKFRPYVSFLAFGSLLPGDPMPAAEVAAARGRPMGGARVERDRGVGFGRSL